MKANKEREGKLFPYPTHLLRELKAPLLEGCDKIPGQEENINKGSNPPLL